MKTIKINATDSTNTFLKELAQNSAVENFTTVVANTQLKGRGQQNQKWFSEPNKNLTFSTFVIFDNFKIKHQKYLNYAISLAIYEVLFNENLPKLSIKWPNDIMSVNKKICGILIENTFIGNKIKNAVIGIGVNVNQECFPDFLKNKATSLKIENNNTYDLTILLNKLLLNIKVKIKLLKKECFTFLEDAYLKVLYKKNIPTMFKNSRDEIFIGIISGVSEDGKLQILLENDTIKEFGIKEVTFL